jgi:hypothetical protein
MATKEAQNLGHILVTRLGLAAAGNGGNSKWHKRQNILVIEMKLIFPFPPFVMIS